MKNANSILLIAVMIVSVCFSCGTKTDQSEQEEANSTEQVTEVVYACPMHPEVTGKKGDTCSKCGMPLEEVDKGDSTHMHEEHH